MKNILITVFLIITLVSCGNKNDPDKADDLWGRLDESAKKKILRQLSHKYSALHKECRVIELTVRSTDDAVHLEFLCGNEGAIQQTDLMI